MIPVFVYPTKQMSTTYLLIMAVIAAICIFFARKKNSDAASIKETTMSPSERVIQVYDMDEAKLNDTIEEYTRNYAENEEEHPTVVIQQDGIIRLTFTAETDYISFCYWVNYLVYCDEEKQKRYTVYGWYPFGELEINGERQPFSNQTVMLYVDKNDTQYDNISFVTPDGSHYLQPFAIFNNLKPIVGGSESYRLCPNPETQETQ